MYKRDQYDDNSKIPRHTQKNLTAHRLRNTGLHPNHPFRMSERQVSAL